MSLSPRPFRLLNRILRLGTVLLAVALAASAPTRAGEPDSELKLVIVLTRHGVRSPLQTNQTLGKYAAEPWPEWTVGPGILTPHGREAMVLFGAYYRARYVQEGLLTGRTAEDAPRVFFRADNDQRTIETTRALADGLLPGAEPEVHAWPAGRVDPLFQPVKAAPGLTDRSLAIASVLGRIGGDLNSLPQAHQEVFATLEQVLCGGTGRVPPGKTSLLDVPAKLEPGQKDHAVELQGPLRVGEQIVDALLLEYTEGMPMKDVGWGRLSPAKLTEVLQLHSLYFDLTQATLYPAQAQVSNLAAHLLQTIEQSVTGQPVPGAIGAPGQKLIMVVGHDTNIANLGGLLGLNWLLPGTQANPVLPGGAMVFELRRRPHDGPFFIRIYYMSQSLEQTRTLQTLTLATPPGIAPIFIPGCSESGPGFDAPLDRFEHLLHRVIDPKFVVPGTP
jgi:4-phytase/acid phosphatase